MMSTLVQSDVHVKIGIFISAMPPPPPAARAF